MVVVPPVAAAIIPLAIIRREAPSAVAEVVAADIRGDGDFSLEFEVRSVE